MLTDKYQRYTSKLVILQGSQVGRVYQPSSSYFYDLSSLVLQFIAQMSDQGSKYSVLLSILHMFSLLGLLYNNC